MKKTFDLKHIIDETEINGPMMVYRKKNAQEEKEQSDYFLKLKENAKKPKPLSGKLTS